MTAELARLLGLGALLLSFAIVAGRRAQPIALAAQLAAVALAALCQAALQSDLGLVAVTAILAVQGVLLWFNRPVATGRAPFPVLPLCAALALVALATASAPSDAVAVPMAMVLVGLLVAATAPGPYGVLSMLNGVALGLVEAPGLPLRPLTAGALAVLAVIVVVDGRRVAWMRR